MRLNSAVASAALLLALAVVPASAQLRAQVVAQGLSSPVAFVPDPTSTTRFFIVEQGGLIRVLDNGVLLATPFLDLRTAVRTGGEQGLLGMAFAPDAATSGRFFLYFTKPRAGDSSGNDLVIARFRRSPATAATAPTALAVAPSSRAGKTPARRSSTASVPQPFPGPMSRSLSAPIRRTRNSHPRRRSSSSAGRQSTGSSGCGKVLSSGK